MRPLSDYHGSFSTITASCQISEARSRSAITSFSGPFPSARRSGFRTEPNKRPAAHSGRCPLLFQADVFRRTTAKPDRRTNSKWHWQALPITDRTLSVMKITRYRPLALIRRIDMGSDTNILGRLRPAECSDNRAGTVELRLSAYKLPATAAGREHAPR